MTKINVKVTGLLGLKARFDRMTGEADVIEVLPDDIIDVPPFETGGEDISLVDAVNKLIMASIVDAQCTNVEMEPIPTLTATVVRK